MLSFGKLYRIAALSVTEYRKSNPLLLASSTSFFSLFALPPILIILISILGLVVKPDMLRGELFATLSSVFGEESAGTVNMIFKNFRAMGDRPLTSALGFVFLVFVATTLLGLIKRSINQLWHLRVRGGGSLRAALAGRGLSFLIVVASGILFLFSLLADAFLAFLGNYLHELFSGKEILIVKSINALFSVLSITSWFSVIFKFLPNARIGWKPALAGGFFTALLFSAGKFILGKVLVEGNIGEVFGPSGSVILLLLFIFYSALIFYYGAVFTKNYATATGQPVKAGRRAVKFKILETEETHS